MAAKGQRTQMLRRPGSDRHIIATMRKLTFILVALILILGAALGVAYWFAGRQPGPTIQIARPEKYVGVTTPLEVTIDAPGGELTTLEIAFEQNGARVPLYSMASAAPDAPVAQRTTEPPDRVRVTRDIGRESVAGIKSGPARIVVTASRPVLFGLRQAATEAAHDVEVRLERPRIAALSTHHYINQGGAEMVVYRVTPDDVTSGVVVGDIEYPGFPGTGVTADGVSIADPAVRVAFFALRYDQPLDTPIRSFARDEAGNSARAEFDHRTFPKPAARAASTSTTPSSNAWCRPSSGARPRSKPTGTPLEQFLVINGDLRRKNNETIASFAAKTSPSSSARRRSFTPSPTPRSSPPSPIGAPTSTRTKTSISRRTSASTWPPTPARRSSSAARGTVLFANELGIYGNCVIVDHGMGVQSLYAHLSSIGVAPGATVEKEQELGKERHDRPRRRRPPALHHAGQRPDGESGRVVGPALDRRSDPAQAARAAQRR